MTISINKTHFVLISNFIPDYKMVTEKRAYEKNQMEELVSFRRLGKSSITIKKLKYVKKNDVLLEKFIWEKNTIEPKEKK